VCRLIFEILLFFRKLKKYWMLRLEF